MYERQKILVLFTLYLAIKIRKYVWVSLLSELIVLIFSFANYRKKARGAAVGKHILASST